MLKNLLNLLYFGLVICLWVPLNGAEGVPDYISYQGKLVNSAGLPVPDGTYQVQFKLYKSETETTPVWTSSISNVYTTGGFFTTQIGAVPADVFSSSDIWLEVVLDGKPLLPRIKLSSVPFAIRAAEVSLPFCGTTNSSRPAFTVTNTGSGGAIKALASGEAYAGEFIGRVSISSVSANLPALEVDGVATFNKQVIINDDVIVAPGKKVDGIDISEHDHSGPGQGGLIRWDKISNQRSLRVERYVTLDAIGETVEWTHVTNGVIGFLFETGYGSTWANSHNQVTIHRTPVIALGLDYANPDNSHANSPFTPFHGRYGSRCWSCLTELGFQNGDGVEIDPDSLSPLDEKLVLYFSRWVGCGGLDGNQNNPQFNCFEDKTAAIYLADSEGKPIFRNDSGSDANITEACDLRPSNFQRALVGKVIQYDGPKEQNAIQGDILRLYFYIKGPVSGSPSLTVWVFPSCRFNNYPGYHFVRYRRSSPMVYTHQGPRLGTGPGFEGDAWNYIDLDSIVLCPGTNLIVLDGKDMSATNKFSIGVDTSVKTTQRNKAYLLYQNCANYWRVIRTKYTFYRDYDKIDMEPSVPANPIVSGLTPAALASFEYNFGMGKTLFREMPYEYTPCGPGADFLRLSYKHYCPNRLNYLGTEWVPSVLPFNFPWLVWDANGKAQVDFYRQSDPSKAFKVTIDKNGTSKSLQLMIGKFDDVPYWYRASEAPDCEFNDWIFHVDGAVQPGAPMPIVTLDVSS
ncbi:MAG: hypothetical protein QME62_01345, partial [Armatimonadota bacterium]|nr:hypothetical protein [Armatimonadota bacterium]